MDTPVWIGVSTCLSLGQIDKRRLPQSGTSRGSSIRAVVARLDLPAINEALIAVETDWPRIDAELARLKIGRKDPFTAFLRANMLSGYAYLDQLLEQGIAPLSDASREHLLLLNERVHYGTDAGLRAEYDAAIVATAEKFNVNIDPILHWHQRHTRHGNNPYKLAAETYVSIVGQPQLFVEGNHRTGALIASWINLYAGLPPFVLSVDNALTYFAPSAEIKQFADRSTWRGRRRIPKYRKSFRVFWEQLVERKYLLGACG